MTTESLLNADQTNTAAGAEQNVAATTENQAAATSTTEPNANEQAVGTEQTGNQTEDEGAKTEENKTEEQAPAEYEEFKAPEGVELDKEAIGEFKDIAKELKLSQADAQRLVDIGPKMLQKWQNQQAETVSTEIAKWTQESTKDSEFGGSKLSENLSVAKKALDTFGTPELKAWLDSTGQGNHPEIIRLLYRAGKHISEDQHISGKRVGATTHDARAMYPNSNMN